VAHDAQAAAGVLKHAGRNLPGVSATLRPENILRSDHNGRSPEGLSGGSQGGKGRGDRHIDLFALEAVHLLLETLAEIHGLRDGLEHLPVAGDQRNPGHHFQLLSKNIHPRGTEIREIKKME
jgi:hypothetical protein